MGSDKHHSMTCQITCRGYFLTVSLTNLTLTKSNISPDFSQFDFQLNREARRVFSPLNIQSVSLDSIVALSNMDSISGTFPESEKITSRNLSPIDATSRILASNHTSSTVAIRYPIKKLEVVTMLQDVLKACSQGTPAMTQSENSGTSTITTQ